LSFKLEPPQICFETVVDSFSLTIFLGMIGCDAMQLSSLEIEQLFSKFSSESGIMVRCNKVGHSMEFRYIVHKNLGHGGCCEWVLEGIKTSIFGKMINDNHDD
jgi:hypothetical protein